MESQPAYIMDVQEDLLQTSAKQFGIEFPRDPQPTPEPFTQSDYFIHPDQINRLPSDLVYGLQELTSLAPQDGTGPYVLPNDPDSLYARLLNFSNFLQQTSHLSENEIQSLEQQLIVGVITGRRVDLKTGIVTFSGRYPTNPEPTIDGTINFDQQIQFEIDIRNLSELAFGFPDQTPDIVEPNIQFAATFFIGPDKQFHLTNFMTANQMPEVNPFRGRGKTLNSETTMYQSVTEPKINIGKFSSSPAISKYTSKGFSTQPKRLPNKF